MNGSDLEAKWGQISDNEISNGYRSLRLPAECVSEVFLAIDSFGSRCLLLSLPMSYEIDFRPVEKEKLSLEVEQVTNHLILALRDEGFADLFDDLIVFLYNEIKEIYEVDEYVTVFIQAFNKWSAFFDDQESDRLSYDTIKGIFGELQVLKDLIESSASGATNELLEAWKGPYDTGHDFVLNDRNIEVKTKEVSKLQIGISSEIQLEAEHGKGLELLVLSVESDLLNGNSLRDKFIQVKGIVVGKGGDTSILIKAIKQKGLTQKNIHEYDNFRFALRSEDVYDCLEDGFPRLIKANMDKSITRVKYRLILKGLEKFRLSHRDF